MDAYGFGIDTEVSSTRQQRDHRTRSYGSNLFVPSNEPEAAPPTPVKLRPAFPQPFTSSRSQAFANDTHGVNNSSGPSPDVSQAAQANVHSSSLIDDQDSGLSRYRSQPHPVPATQSQIWATDDSGEYSRACPTPTSRRPRGPIVSNLTHGSVNDEFAAFGHRSLNQPSGTMSDMPGLRTGINTFNPLSGQTSNPYGAPDPYIIGQRTLPPYGENVHGASDGWAYANGIPSLTAPFVDHTSNERSQHDDMFHPCARSSGRHPPYGLRHTTKAAESGPMVDSPTTMNTGQRWSQPMTSRTPLTNTSPHPFAQFNSWNQPRLLSPLDNIDRTISSPPYSGMSLSSPILEGPVGFSTQDSGNQIVPQAPMMPATAINPPSTALPPRRSRHPNPSHPPPDSADVCPYCQWVSKGKKPGDRKSNLKRHIRDKHERAEHAKPMCPEPGCGRTFGRGDNMLKHRRIRHGILTTT